MSNKARAPIPFKTVTVKMPAPQRGAEPFTFDVDYTNQLGPDLVEPQRVRLHAGEARIDISSLLSDEAWGSIELAIAHELQSSSGAEVV